MRLRARYGSFFSVSEALDETRRGAVPRAATPPQLGEGTTWILAIMPPSSCSRMWQW